MLVSILSLNNTKRGDCYFIHDMTCCLLLSKYFTGIFHTDMRNLALHEPPPEGNCPHTLCHRGYSFLCCSRWRSGGGDGSVTYRIVFLTLSIVHSWAQALETRPHFIFYFLISSLPSSLAIQPRQQQHRHHHVHDWLCSLNKQRGLKERARPGGGHRGPSSKKREGKGEQGVGVGCRVIFTPSVLVSFQARVTVKCLCWWCVVLC